MSAHTDLVRSACDWVDRHPELPEPGVSGYTTPSVHLSWDLRGKGDETAAAKAILAAAGGPSAWKAIPHGDRVILLGPTTPFHFAITVSAPQPVAPTPADIDALEVTW